MPNNDFQKEGAENVIAPEPQQAPEQPENQPEFDMEKMVTGGDLKEDKAELEKIIARNREQVEKNDAIIEEQLPERKLMEQFDKEKIQPAAPASQGEDDEKENIKKHADEVYSISDPAQQIDKIVQLAITKDPFYAVKVAQHLDDNYVLNEVHDRLVEDQVREELIKRGLLKEIE